MKMMMIVVVSLNYPQQSTRNKKNAKQSNQMKNTDITIQMFTPCIMVFSLFFNVDLSDREWETYDVCLVQQHYYCQIVLCLQVKDISVSCYVHQHQFLKFWSFSQEEGPCVVFCVLQHYCIKFEFFSLVRVIVDSFDVQWHPWLESVLSYWERESLNIASPLQNLFSYFVGRNIQHAFWFELEFKC